MSAKDFITPQYKPSPSLSLQGRGGRDAIGCSYQSSKEKVEIQQL